jgi:hypothetical protein
MEWHADADLAFVSSLPIAMINLGKLVHTDTHVKLIKPFS